MKKLQQVFFLGLGMMFSSSLAFGGVGSHGGIGVRCGTGLRALDLYESTEIHHLELAPAGFTLDENFRYFGRKMSDYLSTDPIGDGSEERKSLNEFVAKQFVWVAPGSLRLSRDATLPALPAGCKFVQIALYDDVTDRLFVDEGLWSELDFQNQTALVLHEIVYKLARIYYATKSDDTRRLIGLIFSTTELPPLWAPAFGKVGLHCATMTGLGNGDPKFVNEFFMVDETRSGKSGVTAYFSVVNKNFQLSRTESFLPGLSVAEILRQGGLEQASTARQSFMEREWTFSIHPGSFMPTHRVFSIRTRLIPQNGTRPKVSEGYCESTVISDRSIPQPGPRP